MAKITKAHIIAARGRKQILEDQKKPVPSKIVKLAALNLAKFPSTQEVTLKRMAEAAEAARPARPAERGRTPRRGVSPRFAGASEAVLRAAGRAPAPRNAVSTSSEPKHSR